MRSLSKIVLLLSVLTVTLSANLPKIDECKSDLYYANGILIQQSKRDARKIWEIKATKLLDNNLELRKNIDSYLVAYNHSYGTTSDLFESFIQKTESEPGYKATWEGFKLYVGLKIKKADDLLGLAEIVNNSIENYDLTEQVNAYKNSIKSGHGVIIVSHSQGNLFTNRAYDKIEDWMKPYFHNMGVATPADKVASDGPYVTFDNDPIHHIPGALEDNLYNENRYYLYTNALGEKVEALTGAFHAFDYYLGTLALINDVNVSSNQAAEKIKSFILEKIQAHLNAPSQWEQDLELNNGTKDYRITVKHRFDASITKMDGVEVFPFAPSKKLYYVDGNIAGYVKASCGGTQIFDSWTDQQSGEAYLINNPQEEKIISGLRLKYDSILFIYDKEWQNFNDWNNYNFDAVKMYLYGHTDGQSDVYITQQYSEITPTASDLGGEYYSNHPIKGMFVGSWIFYKTSDIEELKSLIGEDIPLQSTNFHFTQEMFDKLVE